VQDTIKNFKSKLFNDLIKTISKLLT